MLDPIMKKAFKNLIKKYRSITKNDIENIIEKHFNGVFPTGKKIMKLLTGFGSVSSCKLCKASFKVNNNYILCDCKECYIEINGNVCNEELNGDTYYEIHHSRNVESLLISIKNRADYIEGLLYKRRYVK